MTGQPLQPDRSKEPERAMETSAPTEGASAPIVTRRRFIAGLLQAAAVVALGPNEACIKREPPASLGAKDVAACKSAGRDTAKTLREGDTPPALVNKLARQSELYCQRELIETELAKEEEKLSALETEQEKLDAMSSHAAMRYDEADEAANDGLRKRADAEDALREIAQSDKSGRDPRNTGMGRILAQKRREGVGEVDTGVRTKEAVAKVAKSIASKKEDLEKARRKVSGLKRKLSQINDELEKIDDEMDDYAEREAERNK